MTGVGASDLLLMLLVGVDGASTGAFLSLATGSCTGVSFCTSALVASPLSLLT